MTTSSRSALLLALVFFIQLLPSGSSNEDLTKAPLGGRVEMEIDGAMGTIKRSLKALTDDIEDKKKVEENLKLILQLQAAFTVCKSATPDKIAALEGKAKDKALTEYRLMNIEVLHIVLDLEAAVVDGKLPKAKKLLSKIASFEGKGHGKFKD